MIGQEQILTQKDLEGYKKIADSFANVDDSRVVDSIAYFNTYIDKNKNSTNPEIAKKVFFAQKIVDALRPNGGLRSIKEYMHNASESIVNTLNDAKNEDPVKTEFTLNDIHYLGFLVPYEKLDGVNHEEILTAYQGFMEGDNFAEYKSDSPIRYIGEYLNACASAHRGFQQIEANVSRNEYSSVITNNNITKTNLDEIKVIDQAMKDNRSIGKNVAIAYNSDVDLENLDAKLKQAEEGIKQREDEIAKLQEKYIKIYPEETEAQKTLPELSETVKKLENQFKNETLSALSGDARNQANKDKEAFRNALAVLAKAHNDIKELRKENPDALYTPFAQAQEKENEYKKLEAEYEDFKKKIDKDGFINNLIQNEPNKEQAKTTLSEQFEFYKKNKEEETKWNNIQQKYFQFKQAFGNKPEFLNYLIGDDDAMREGYKKLEEEYTKPGVKDGQFFLDMAIAIKKDIYKEMGDRKLFESYFNYDGKTSQEEYLKQLDKKIQDKVDEFPKERNENPLDNAYFGYVNTKASMEEIEKQINAEVEKGDQANKDTIIDLTEKISLLSNKNMEHWTTLKNAGIENPDTLGQLRTFAQRRGSHANNDDLTEMREATYKAKRIAEMSRKYADNLSEALKVVTKFEQAKNIPGVKCLYGIIYHDNPDYSKLPDDVKYLEEVNKQYAESVENNLKNYAKDTEEKLAAAKEKHQKLSAVFEKNECQQIIDAISQKKAELETFKEAKQFFEKKKANITKVINDYKDAFEEPFANLEEKYNNYPKLNTQDEYRRMYLQIESFREDFDKCRRSDYINGSKRNSTEYENIKTALDQFKSWEEFRAMTPMEISGKLGYLASVADIYKTEKLKEVRPMWSPQRRYRLGYADRIKGFANAEKALMNDYISYLDEQKQAEDKQAAYDLVQTANPAKTNDQSIISALAGSNGLEAELNSRKEARDYLANALASTFNTIVKKIKDNRIDPTLFKQGLEIIDAIMEQKEKYQNPELIAEKGIENITAEIKESLKSANVKKRAGEFETDNEKVQKYDDIIKTTSAEDILKCKNVTEFISLINKNAQKEQTKKDLNQKAKNAMAILNAEPSNMKKIQNGDAEKLIKENITLKKNPVRKPAPKPFNA